MKTTPIGRALVNAGIISREQAADAMEAQRAQGGLIGQHLILAGAVSRKEMYQLLAKQWRAPMIDLLADPPDPALLVGEPHEIVARGWVPWRREDDVVVVATSVPPTGERLVVGSRGVRWFTEIASDEVAARLARHAESPVVVVPEDAGTAWQGTDVVVCPDDDRSVDGAVWEFAFDQALARGGALRVEHHAPGRAETVAADIGAWRDLFPDVPVSFGTPDAGGACGLVVVQRPADRTVPLGHAHSSALVIAQRDACPVAVVPPD